MVARGGRKLSPKSTPPRFSLQGRAKRGLTRQLVVLAALQRGERRSDIFNPIAQSRPACCWQDQNRELAARQRLLVSQITIIRIPGGRSGDLQAAGGVLQYGLDLLTRHAREPFEELGHGGAILNVLEQRMNRHARTMKHPGAAYDAWDLLNCLTGAPIQHYYTLLRTRQDGKW